MNRFVAIIVGLLYSHNLLGTITIHSGESKLIRSADPSDGGSHCDVRLPDTTYIVEDGGIGIVDGHTCTILQRFDALTFHNGCTLSLLNGQVQDQDYNDFLRRAGVAVPANVTLELGVNAGIDDGSSLQFGATGALENPVINIVVQQDMPDVGLLIVGYSITPLVNSAPLTNMNLGNSNFKAITPGYVFDTTYISYSTNGIYIHLQKASGTSGSAHSGSFANLVGVTSANRASASSHRTSTVLGRAFKKALFGPEESYLAQATDDVLPQGSVIAFARKGNHHAIWMRGLGRKSHQDPIQFFPSYEISTWGDTIGYDYMYDEGMVAGCLGYVHSFVKEGERAGSGIINSGIASIKGAVYLPRSYFFEYGLAGSVNFNRFKRNIFSETAHSSFKTYTLDPHFDVGVDIKYKDWFVFEPFMSADFVFGFQGAYDEYGAGAFNQHYGANNTGIFRLEPGLNYFQYWMGDWGAVILREKTSYVLKQPMYGTKTTTSVISNPGDIIVESGLFRQNLFSVAGQLFARFHQGTFASASYRGEWGSGFHMNELHLRIGQYF